MRLLFRCGIYLTLPTTPRLRRKKIKLSSGISMPYERTNDEVLKQLKEKIKAGLYTMGEVIVPQKFQKLSINKDGEAEIVDVVVSGRKYPLLHMCHQMLKDHDKYLRLFSDKEYNELSKEKIKTELMRINEYESAKNLTTVQQLDILKAFQRTRNLMLWHDTSTISDHSYLLMMVKCVYDHAIFFTNEEYEYMYNKKINNIQVEIEKPVMYILARCPPTDDQIKYIDTRLEDLIELKTTLFTE